jgi:GNAT superfamily N-acetyltransferase
LFGCFADGTLAAVAGVSVQRVLHHARHAWIHDFVVDEVHRSAGYGTALLEFVEDCARERGCEYVALAVRSGNDDALRFYEGARLDQWGHVIETEL